MHMHIHDIDIIIKCCRLSLCFYPLLKPGLSHYFTSLLFYSYLSIFRARQCREEVEKLREEIGALKKEKEELMVSWSKCHTLLFYY